MLYVLIKTFWAQQKCTKKLGSIAPNAPVATDLNYTGKCLIKHVSKYCNLKMRRVSASSQQIFRF